MVVSKYQYSQDSVRIDNQDIAKVSQFKYLGYCITEDLSNDAEIKLSCTYARCTFTKMKNLLCDKGLNLGVRQGIVKSYIYSILLYGIEIATLNRK